MVKSLRRVFMLGALALSLALGIAGYSAPASGGGGCGGSPIPCMPVN